MNQEAPRAPERAGRPSSCATCGGPAEEVLLCAGCLARAHPGCREDACAVCGDATPPLGPVRAGEGTPTPVVLPRWTPPPRRAGRVRWRRVAAAGLVLVALGLALAPTPRVPAVRAAEVQRLRTDLAGELLAAAQARIQARDWAAAASELDQSLTLDPALVQAWHLRSYVRCEQRDYAGAVADATRTLELRPDHWVTLSNRAWARYHLGDYAGARADRLRAIELVPGSADAWNGLGCLELRVGDAAAAVAACDRALSLDPNHAYAWQNRARARFLLGDVDGAETDVARALELDPANSWAWHTRGLVRLARDDLAGAEADLARALELGPNSPEPSPGLEVLARELAQRRSEIPRYMLWNGR